MDAIYSCFPDSIPFICFDYGLVLQALSDLVENSLCYESPDKRIDICGELVKVEMRVFVRNHGPKLQPQDETCCLSHFIMGQVAISV